MKFNKIIWILTIILFVGFIYSLIFSKPKYTIVYDTVGGSNVKSTIIKEGKKVPKPSAPVKEGYIFKYWSLDDKEYDFNKPVKSNITLTAVWEEEQKEEDVKPTDKDKKKTSTKKSSTTKTTTKNKTTKKER